MSLETMTKLFSTTVGAGGVASVVFSNIPQNYTDLVVKVSARDTGNNGGMYMYLNGSTTGYSAKGLYGSGSAAGSESLTNGALLINPSGATASVFGNADISIFNYSGNTYKSISSEGVSENNATTTYMEMFAELWSNSAPVTSLTFSAVSGNLAQYSTFTLYGIKNAAQTAGNSIKATGGAISFDGTYVIHAFNSTGSFTPTQPILADVVVIAGGGAAGATTGGGWAGGGGGAGGYRVLYSTPLAANTTYVTTIGAGGAGVSGSGGTGGNGGNSTFGGGPILYSATGGGGGGTSEVNGNTKTNGQSGGSGGGGAQTMSSVSGGSGNAGGYSPVEGYAGRSTTNNPGQGGGAGGVGLDSVYGTVPTPNGVTSLNGQYYAMGGYCLNVAAGSTAADPFTGNGGKSRNDGTGTNLAGGNGGSGTVLIRYKG